MYAAGDQATRRPAPRNALPPRARSYRGRSSIEFRRLDLDFQFWDRLVESEPLEQLCDFGTESLPAASSFLYGIAQNIADFLLHGMAMARSTPLELALDGVFQVANNHLGHIDPLAIMIAFSLEKYKVSRFPNTKRGRDQWTSKSAGRRSRKRRKSSATGGAGANTIRSARSTIGHRKNSLRRQASFAAGRYLRSASRSTATGRRPACSADVSIPSTRCSRPAPMPLPGGRTGTRFATPTTRSIFVFRGPPTGTRWATSFTRTRLTTATIRE